MIMRGPVIRKTCTRVGILTMVRVMCNIRKCICLLARISCVSGQTTAPFANYYYNYHYDYHHYYSYYYNYNYNYYYYNYYYCYCWYYYYHGVLTPNNSLRLP